MAAGCFGSSFEACRGSGGLALVSLPGMALFAGAKIGLSCHTEVLHLSQLNIYIPHFIFRTVARSSDEQIQKFESCTMLIDDVVNDIHVDT